MPTRRRNRIKPKRVVFGKELLTLILLIIFSNHIIFSSKVSGWKEEEANFSSVLLLESSYGNFANQAKFSRPTLLSTALSSSTIFGVVEYHVIPRKVENPVNLENCKQLLLESSKRSFANHQNESLKKRKVRRRRRVGRRANKTGKVKFTSVVSIVSNSTRPKRQVDRLIIALRMKNVNFQDNNNATNTLQEDVQKTELKQSVNTKQYPTHTQTNKSGFVSSGSNGGYFPTSSIPTTTLQPPKAVSDDKLGNTALPISASTATATSSVIGFDQADEATLSFDSNLKIQVQLEKDHYFANSTSASPLGTIVNSSITEEQEDSVVGVQDNEKKQTRQLILQKFCSKYPIEIWKSLGLFEDAYLADIDIHWLQYEPASDFVHNTLAAIYTIFMIVGCGGNALVIFMFFRCRSLRTPPNYLIVNLAVSDFLMMAKTPVFIVNSYYRGPALGAMGCRIYGFVGGLTGTASIMSLASIALDRYFVIVHPLNPFKRITSRRAILMIIAVWSYAGLFSAIPLFGFANKYTSEGYLTSCSFDYLSSDVGSRVFVFIFFLAAWLFPLMIISFSYWHIWRIVRAAEKMDIFPVRRTRGKKISGGEDPRENFRCRQDKEKSELKIAVLAMVIIALWVLAWTPYAVVALMGIVGWKQYLSPLVSAIPALFCKTASCIDPFVYSINHPRFQRELRSKFKICFVGYYQHQRGDWRTKSRDGERNNASYCTAVSFRIKSEGCALRRGGNVDIGSFKGAYACPITLSRKNTQNRVENEIESGGKLNTLEVKLLKCKNSCYPDYERESMQQSKLIEDNSNCSLLQKPLDIEGLAGMRQYGKGFPGKDNSLSQFQASSQQQRKQIAYYSSTVLTFSEETTEDETGTRSGPDFLEMKVLQKTNSLPDISAVNSAA